MLTALTTQYHASLQAAYDLLFFVNALLHLAFAGAVAKDAGQLQKIHQKTALVSGATWAFATLLGGVITASIYWFIHHSIITRSSSKGAT